MAIFGSKKEEVKEKKVVSVPTNLENVIKHPRVTEKASFRTEGNVYTFEVDTKADKKQIARAIEGIYKVKPIKVNVAKIPAKSTFSRGKKGIKSGGKKAFVYLKEGDSIELV